ncbi:MAG: hypothetical protein NTY20_05245 [Candidatus Aenigmarchaeota archaeon]|nr:hypothetical protein [Candidatus Aenigmarchaeota archaeon]
MDKKFDDLLWKEPTIWMPPSGRNWNYEKILAISDPEFSEFYLALMTEYRDNEGWWSGEKIPKCFKCHNVIPGPETLRRLTGRTLDPECFRVVYASERNDYGPIVQKYWDRVAKLDLTGKP